MTIKRLVIIIFSIGTLSGCNEDSDSTSFISSGVVLNQPYIYSHTNGVAVLNEIFEVIEKEVGVAGEANRDDIPTDDVNSFYRYCFDLICTPELGQEISIEFADGLDNDVLTVELVETSLVGTINWERVEPAVVFYSWFPELDPRLNYYLWFSEDKPALDIDFFHQYSGIVQQTLRIAYDDEDFWEWGGGDNLSTTIQISYKAKVNLIMPLEEDLVEL